MTSEVMAMAGARFERQVLDLLSALGEVSLRPLFGGHGVCWGETIFAIVFGGRLYLKVDERSKGDCLASGWVYSPSHR